MELAPRYRQRLAAVPFGVHDPVWVDDPDFDPARHLYAAEGDMIDEVLSTPLPRDRPRIRVHAHHRPTLASTRVGKISANTRS